MSLPLDIVAPLIGRGIARMPLPPGTYVFVMERGSRTSTNPPASLHIVNYINPSDDTFPYGHLGYLPPDIRQPYAAFSYNGGLYVCDRVSPRSIWRINPNKPGSTVSPYGKWVIYRMG